MSPDEPLALEPARGLSPLATNLLIGAVAFGGGIAGTWAVLQWSGKTAPPPPAVQTAQPQPTPQPAALPPGTDLSTLAAREAMLASRLDALDSRLRDIDGSARAASSFATQAERLMIAFAARRAIERGLPLGPLEGQLRARFGETHGEAVSTLIAAAGQPVTLEDLRLALDTLSPRLTSAANEGMWARMRRLLGDLVVLRQDGAASPRAADRLRRARRAIDEGNVEAALAEVARMPGAADAQSWTSAAKRYIAARNALREIELAAMETSPVPAPTATR
ncbi:hypothetical protein OF829_05900 [Sphingomonas sp. LB-2]|uniref:hypothetical protein n=1 Tax=Sphingomonas caeni TaxID=2984949 RepID=UPI00222EF8AD|nr:hypothetical protein [Sphingomonas caeni]MCW3846765.1 hypothetical protein [Sphingomonas caeni]